MGASREFEGTLGDGTVLKERAFESRDTRA